MIPDEALDDRFAIVGTSGSGKTYAARGLAERLLRQSARLCIVDPTGVSWGLRLGADGKERGGFPVAVLGGRRGDLPLSEHDGGPLGRIIATADTASIIDLSEMPTNAARRRFMTAFAEALYDHCRAPLHLILDEADLWAPQRPQPEAFNLLGRIEEIVRRGRVRGFIPWLITQRPAVIHKDVLSQADALIAMKLTASQDRDAIGAWIEGQADRVEGKRILADLPRLPRGEGYVWSPGRDILERVAFPSISTFDSGRTPRRGEQTAEPTALTGLDIAMIRDALQKAAPAAPSGRLQRGASAEIETAREEGRRQGRAESEGHIATLTTQISERDAAIQAAVSALTGIASQAAALASPPPRLAQAPPKPRPPRAPAASNGAEMRLLRVLAAQGRLTEAQWATVAGMKRTGGTWRTYRSRLRAAGYVEQDGRLFWCSVTGLRALPDAPPPTQTPDEILTMWRNTLGAGVARLLDALIANPNGLDSPSLASIAQMSEAGGTFRTYLSRLRSNGLIESNKGQHALADWLRPTEKIAT